MTGSSADWAEALRILDDAIRQVDTEIWHYRCPAAAPRGVTLRGAMTEANER